MVACEIWHYLKSAEGRVVLLKRTANFAAVPFIGSQLSLKDDNLEVVDVRFEEDGAAVLIAETADLQDQTISDAVEDAPNNGWTVSSDIVRGVGRRRA